MTDVVRELLLHSGLRRVSLMTAAHELDPKGERIGIKDVIAAIDAYLPILATCRIAGELHWARLAAAIETPLPKDAIP